MSSNEKATNIPPALTKEEWGFQPRWKLYEQYATVVGNEAKMIALANDDLLDGDRRKITWAMVDAIGMVLHSSECEPEEWEATDHALDVLKSYLPPREGANVPA